MPTFRSLPSKVLLASLLWASTLASAVEPTETDPNVIMDAVTAQDTGDKQKSRVHITIIDKAGRERTRSIVTRAMDFDGGSKQLMLFEGPADVRNAGLLSINHDDASKNDDQWLYLPSLAKTSRISGADRSGSFMGTDLTYADMGDRDTENYDYTLVQGSATVDGDDCWVIESRPNADEASETGYVKSHTWISKSKLIPVQVKAWVLEGKKLKYTKFGEIQQINGIWVPHRIVVRTVKGTEVQSTSTLVFSEIAFDQEDVVSSDFTERRLEQGL
ncbi:MAG: outer membrane lipoprotein-sorting protein [Proteobacteria bacterium]|nr:outer membrane lipoprotein-sorting protein [Pseudomonadota bacterium]